MRIIKSAAAAALALGAFGLTACAETLDTTVSRYQADAGSAGPDLLRGSGRRHGRSRRA